MTDKPVFDRAALEDIMSTAKAARVRHLGNAWRQSPKGFRWSGLGVIVASSLAVTGAHFVTGAHAGNSHSAYFHNLLSKR
jgi:hypothetical protein